MRRLLLDTNILIYASQGKFDRQLLLAQHDILMISVVSKVEALGFAYSDAAEEMIMQRLIQGMAVLDFTDLEAQHAIRYRKARKIKFPDAAILATARAAGADLLTENLGDFRGLDAQVRVLGLADL